MINQSDFETDEIGVRNVEIMPKFRAVSYVSPVGTVEIFSSNDLESEVIFKLPQKSIIDLGSKLGQASLSPCLEKPFCISSTHFYSKTFSFDSLKLKILSYLVGAEDYDFSYSDDSQTWKCKYSDGCYMSEIHISCFFDSIIADHVIEVRKVRSDGFPSSSVCDLFVGLKKSFGFEQQASAVKQLNKRLIRSGGVGGPSLSMENFESSLKSLNALASEQYFEPRLEAAKLICGLPNKNLEFLQVPCIVSQITHSLSLLLRDKFSEVVECACFAIAAFCSFASYREEFAHDAELLSVLLSLVVNCTDQESSYLCAKMRRKAVEALALVCSSHPCYVQWHLKRSNYQTEALWYRHASGLRDVKTRNMAVSICSCYQALMEPNMMVVEDLGTSVSIDL